jgi:thiazole/oxazole-forming peptide maturase SagD family component
MMTIDLLDISDTNVRAALGAVPPPLHAVLPRIARSFRISSARAPGLVIVGGELALTAAEAIAHGASTMSATGTGRTLADALTTFLGEAIELLSQFDGAGNVVSMDDTSIARWDGGWISEATARVADPSGISWIAGHDAATEAVLAIPADLCLRRSPALRTIQPIGALSSGCAAGPTHDAATLRAILELIERDAAAQWWYGGRPAHALPASDPLFHHANATFATLRAGEASRLSQCLDLTTDLDVPVFAAISMDVDGGNFACGVGCRLDAADAIDAAIRELCQMELSAPLAAMKRDARGEAALNAADHRHLRRAAFDACACALLFPRERHRQRLRWEHLGSSPFGSVQLSVVQFSVGQLTSAQAPLITPAFDDVAVPTPNAIPGACGTRVRSSILAELIAHLTTRDVRIATVDHTREVFDVPVIRALSPDLQPFVPEPLTSRMQHTLTTHGGGAQFTHGTPLM